MSEKSGIWVQFIDLEPKVKTIPLFRGMVKTVKKDKTVKKRSDKYANKLEVSGSFLDIFKATVKNANDKGRQKEIANSRNCAK